MMSTTEYRVSRLEDALPEPQGPGILYVVDRNSTPEEARARAVAEYEAEHGKLEVKPRYIEMVVVQHRERLSSS